NHLQPGSVVLFYTGFDLYFGQKAYYLSYPAISENTAHLMVKKKVKMVGVDFPSVDYAPHRIHDILLSNNILIIENLTNLSSLLPYRDFELLAFPLKIRADSSPVRVVARINNPTK
ncbi:MAG TPA: cyclase family protein, partial [Prolixibacteraceae bacterium]